MRVFLSAARAARPGSPARLISGYETDVTDEHVRAGAFAVLAAPPVTGYVEGEDKSTLPRLVAHPTHKQYRGLPWWEVVVE
jgi:hypothetical protein